MHCAELDALMTKTVGKMKFVRVEMDPKRRLLVFTPQARDGVDLHLLISDGGKHKKARF